MNTDYSQEICETTNTDLSKERGFNIYVLLKVWKKVA